MHAYPYCSFVNQLCECELYATNSTSVIFFMQQVYKEPLYRRYYVSSACSMACVYMTVVSALMIFLPLFLGYSSTGQTAAATVLFVINHFLICLTWVAVFISCCHPLSTPTYALNMSNHSFCLYNYLQLFG